MTIRPVGRTSVYEDIVAQLRAMIERGELRPGDRLPAERALAEQFSVSRNTVREAIRVLSEHGVLESRHGAGTFVVETPDAEFVATFAEAVFRQQSSLRDAFHVRKLIEPETAALAARHATPTQLDSLERLLADQEAAVAQGRSGSDHDQRLHRLLAEASGNEVLLALVTAMHGDLQVLRSEVVQSAERQEASLRAHRAIIQAVRDGHVMQAEKAMRDHLEEIETIIFQKDTPEAS